jgi:prepilin-type N-terminal cleavage/methylation domain-containing protein
MKKQKGFSLIEILLVISIIFIIASIASPNLSEFKKQQTLKNTTADIVSLLNEARNNTIASKNSTTYGVRFWEDKAILFIGTSYIDSSDNIQVNFDSYVKISEDDGLNLNNSFNNEVVFSRLTGDTINYGTIKVELVSDSSRYKIISINNIGIISVQ